MNLQTYLNENFPGPFSEDFLKEHFKSFGVDVNIFQNKFQFKYDQIAVDWNNPLTHFCRGSILHYSFGEGWKYIARPWNKFFNRQEGFSKFSKEEDFEKFKKLSPKLLSKLDGSAILVYFDPDIQDFRASTLGSIQTSNVSDFSLTFSELFWKTFNKNKERFIKGTTSIFELCTIYNRIVTEYNQDKVVFLGTYSNETGEYLEKESEEIGKDLEKPISIPLCPLFNSWKDVEEFVEKESSNPIYGKNSEGFVTYSDKPLFKLKNRNYLHLHGLFTGDKMFVRKNVINLFFSNGLDDVYSDLPEEIKKFSDELKERYLKTSLEIHRAKESLKELKEDRKEYALKIIEIEKENETVKTFKAYLFDCLKEDKEFSKWLLVEKNKKFCYEGYLEWWKND